MSVNGSGLDSRGKPLPDSTTWSVKGTAGVLMSEEKRGKSNKPQPLTGLRADEAFAAVRNFRRQGIFAAAVRS
ncbi:hypothetical protein SEA_PAULODIABOLI_363 [Microbacterium phage PauloDiaboli]|nr:hypothetical protein SEA_PAULODIABOLI_8 [Microbacterium phage PauloDiaboli]QIG58047.1 hypothetical protein SEA_PAULODIABOLI_363 [Microbacterium phage PauloDiaboli]QWY83858.1 hypothetical protein SEA_A3WALLY_8 [Microbacterium phage A3Wally]QWY84169.1 hypothetical protein SEA_A3WALLY_362 [Microbacterium phage A3Wally]